VNVETLVSLTPTHVRAVVINVRTDLAATVALLSLRASLPDVPVLLIDCDPPDSEDSILHRIADRYDIGVHLAPVRPHSTVLDELFSILDDEILLLLDSDADIRDPRFAQRCVDSFSNPNVFGFGILRPDPFWMDEDLFAAPGTGMLAPGPRTSFLALRVDHVQQAFAARRTFGVHTSYNDVAWPPALAYRMAARLQNMYAPRGVGLPRMPSVTTAWLKRTTLPALRWARRDFHGNRPNFIQYDTAARIYEYLRYERLLRFSGVMGRTFRGEIKHYGGVTRAALDDKALEWKHTTSMSDLTQRLSKRAIELGLPEAEAHALSRQG
jgi:hypothetical protein